MRFRRGESALTAATRFSAYRITRGQEALPLKRRSEDLAAARAILGYLNFSSGQPDPSFQRQVDELLARWGWERFPQMLQKVLQELHAEAPAFSDVHQAQAVISLAFEHVLPAYREFHRDLFHHLTAEDFQHSFLLVRFWEAILEQGPPWEETERIVDGVLRRVNDYVGYRPIAVLENGRRMEPYPHERFRPIPLYLRGVGVAHGPYHDLISQALELLRSASEEVLTAAYFSLERMDELALDPRSHDHQHPVNKRMNYLFGEWDPHLIDERGFYRRFVVRKIILDALLQWMSSQRRTSPDECLFDAATVLAGTMLMASAISGYGPDAHDSSVTLTLLLPQIARQRDWFYELMMRASSGTRAQRLQRHAQRTQQPFGHVRQHLNFYLAQYGAQQVQRRFLAQLFARMGFVEPAQKQANIIPCAAARFESEIRWRVTVIERELQEGHLTQALHLLSEAQDFWERGIGCGALADPWNILGFQGQFPLFPAREDSVPDTRIDTLLELVQEILQAYARVVQEAAVRGETALELQVTERFERFAQQWDQYASTTVEELPRVSGREHYESALGVARALAEWKRAGEAAGQVAFWRQHVHQFTQAEAYARVVQALLERYDHVASLALMMQWLSQADEVGLEASRHSWMSLLTQWMQVLSQLAGCSHPSPAQTIPLPNLAAEQLWLWLRRLFDYLEANADEFWKVPRWPLPSPEETSESPSPSLGEDEEDEEHDVPEEDRGIEYDPSRDMFDDGVSDGRDATALDEPGSSPELSELQEVLRDLEPRLQFLSTLSQLWQSAAGLYAFALSRGLPTDPAQSEVIRGWLYTLRRFQQELRRLLQELENWQVSSRRIMFDDIYEFDAQRQSKLSLMQTLIQTCVSFQLAEWLWLALAQESTQGESVDDLLSATCTPVLSGMLRQQPDVVRKTLPALIRALKHQPLLYTPLDHDGSISQIIAARSAQSLIRVLVRHLPRLGLLRETWHVVKTAQHLERNSRHEGLAVTEFDRLFRTALRSTLETLIELTRGASPQLEEQELYQLLIQVVEVYRGLWEHHCRILRISSVELLRHDEYGKRVQHFIERYGAECLQSRDLSLSTIRTILHQGLATHLQMIEQHAGEESLLGQDLRQRRLDLAKAAETMQLILQILAEKYDRFLEYNTTTTQSDYGQKLYSLLDFLLLEAGYDRVAWSLTPDMLLHEVLARLGQHEAAQLCRRHLEQHTERTANDYLQALAEKERQHGMRLPSIANHLGERFIKPLQVHQMLASIGPAIKEARQRRQPGPVFKRLEKLVENYLDNTLGSGLEIPRWLQTLQEELNRVLQPLPVGVTPEGDPEFPLAVTPLSLAVIQQHLQDWQLPLVSRPRSSADES
ncbi:MAG: hypothetical protein KatS3mg113_0128 [Planctomycetaceae bacterium]|nr:MAG: hypothetical protein KatS3mg113_0128 [Planctomycetaceae bacterium]